MAAVANRPVFSRLAAAKGDPFCVFGRVLDGLKLCAGVGIVTKRLRRTAPTRAPFVTFACLDFDVVGKRLCNYGIRHYSTPFMQN
jgi:hypothetical protein